MGRKRKTDRVRVKLGSPAGADQPVALEISPPAVDSSVAPTPEELLSDCATQLKAVQDAIQAALRAGTATPALARESASVARAIAILSKELRDREKATKDRFAKLSDKEREDLLVDCICSQRRAVRLEAMKRLRESLTQKGPKMNAVDPDLFEGAS